MRFNLIDRIDSIADDRIVATKYVSLAEEYLADHFPTFPVLPGVMMLEAITQAATWLMHRRTGFGKSIGVLREARNVKYGQFVAPGNSLRVELDFVKETPAGASFKATGFVDQTTAVAARIELAYFNLADKHANVGEVDAKLNDHNRHRWQVLNATEIGSSVVGHQSTAGETSSPSTVDRRLSTPL